MGAKEGKKEGERSGSFRKLPIRSSWEKSFPRAGLEAGELRAVSINENLREFKESCFFFFPGWRKRHSKYYNSLARLSVIVRQVCNSLIAQAHRSAPGWTWGSSLCAPMLGDTLKATRYISGSSVFEMILQSEVL